jgi:hypothetical protein
MAMAVAYLVACSPTSESLPDFQLLGSAGEARARRLGAEGPFIQHEMAIGQSGDVAIENDGVRFIIRGTDGGDGYVPFAGWIVDAALAPLIMPAQYDGIDGFYPLVNLSPIGASEVIIERDGSDGGPAVVSVTGPLVAVADILGVQGAEPRPFQAEVRLEYSLGPGENALALRTRVLSTSQELEAVDIGDVILFGDDEAEPFTLPAGFDQTSELHEVDGIGSSHETRPVSYAVYASDAPLTLLQGSSVASQLGGDGSLVGYTIESTLLEPGQVLEATRFLAVAPDVDGTLARRLEERGALATALTGWVRAAGEAVAGARVSVFSDPDLRQWVSQAISDASGSFELELEPGRYHVLATGRTTGEYVELPGVRHELAEGHSPSEVQAVSIGAASPDPLELELGPSARVRLEVRTAEGAALAAKVTFQAEDARPPLNPAAGERAPHRNLDVRQVVWTPNGDAELDLEPGLYTVTASHGPNAELDVRHGVELPAGEVTRLALRISEPVVHTEYVAIDPHVHGVYSQHGEVTRLERVVTAAAEGLDVHVATEHDVIADYGSAVAAAGLEGVLTSIPGVELKTNNGDHCAWPLVRAPDEPLGGARRWWIEDRDLQKQYRYYAERGAIVMQLAHGASHFRSAGYDIASGSVSHPERFSFDFNAMEVHNGGGAGGRQALMSYWMSLIDFGHRVAPLAASDSHGRIPEVGVARTYVRTGAAGRDVEAVARATAALHTVASTGPFIELNTADGAGPGDTRGAGPGQPLELVIRVWAPSWMRLDEVQLLAGGSELAHWDSTTEPPVALRATPGVWLEEHVLVEPAEDEWYAVQTFGSVDLAPVYPGMLPWAITAPLFVDADGDGEFRARCVRRPCPAP